MSNTTWRALIEDQMGDTDTLEDTVATSPQDLDLDREFYAGYGGTGGVPFILWTKKYVYFPIQYDGAEWVGSVSRRPSKTGTPYHFGGG